jgi:hypothetical protein
MAATGGMTNVEAKRMKDEKIRDEIGVRKS